MARASFAISNFTAGELSPQLDGRTDLGKYYKIQIIALFLKFYLFLKLMT